MSKQDRQGVRTPADIERKYDLGKEASALNIATDAQQTAKRASNAADDARKATQDLEERVKSLEGGCSLSAYPVGSIYLSVLETNPTDLFGFGTWERIKDKFLLASGDLYAAGSEGAEVSVSEVVEGQPYNNLPPYLAVYVWRRTE